MILKETPSLLKKEIVMKASLFFSLYLIVFSLQSFSLDKGLVANRDSDGQVKAKEVIQKYFSAVEARDEKEIEKLMRKRKLPGEDTSNRQSVAGGISDITTSSVQKLIPKLIRDGRFQAGEISFCEKCPDLNTFKVKLLDEKRKPTSFLLLFFLEDQDGWKIREIRLEPEGE